MNYELSYVSPRDPLWHQVFMRSVETLSGRNKLLPLYDQWRRDMAGKPDMMQQAMDLLGTRLTMTAAPEWHVVPADRPLIMVANHPFGLVDGLSLLSLAERVGRPYRILINSDFMRIPELAKVALPIDFSGTRAAQKVNIETRAEARRLLREGTTITIFPGGGVATADSFDRKAEELPWKHFASRLVEQSKATVVPVFFEGQNSHLFHFVSRFSLSLRLSLLVSEFRRAVGGEVRAHVGEPIPYEALADAGGTHALTEELYVRVHRLAPGAGDKPRDDLRPRPPEERRRYPWDPPLEKPAQPPLDAAAASLSTAR